LGACCREQARSQVREWYATAPSTDRDGKLAHTSKQLKAAYPLFTKPRQFVVRAVDRGGINDRPRSGRPPLESCVPKRLLQAAIDAVLDGWTFQGRQRAYLVGQGLWQCRQCAVVMRRCHLTPTQLLTSMRRTSSDMVVRREVVMRKHTTANAQLRLDIAKSRLEQWEADPNFYQRMFMVDGTAVYHNGLLQQGSSVVTSATNSLAAHPVADKRITWAANAWRYAWIAMVNGVGGPGPLAFITGTVGQEPYVVSLHLAMHRPCASSRSALHWP
jgi:hypothetical protein